MTGIHQPLYKEIIHRLLEGAGDTISMEPLHSIPGLTFAALIARSRPCNCGAALLELSANTP